MSRRGSIGAFVIAGLAVALVLAFVVAPHASSAPDGLERVAAQQHLASGSSAQAVAHHGLSTGVAGVLGVVVTFAAALALSAAVRRRGRGAMPRSAPASTV